MDWEECKDKRLAKEAKIDKPLISSLLKSRDKRAISQKMLSLDTNTASTKVSLAYESLR